MDHHMQDDVLVIELSGRVDTNNADDTLHEVEGIIESTGAHKVELDCAGLSYISSAGLRVIVKLLKSLDELRVTNASPEVYEIFSMTGFTLMMDVRRALRSLSVEGLELLGSGANGSVYRLAPDEMVKAFRPGISLETIEAEREASRAAFTLGIPCAIAFDTVRVGEGYGTVYEMLNAATLTERICADPSSLDEYARRAAELLLELHALEVPDGVLQSAALPYYRVLDKVASDFSADELDLMRSAYDAIPPMNRFVHNDYHTRNIMESNGELMLIDLGESGAGNPLFDLLHSCLVFQLIGTGGGQTHSDDETSFIGISYGELRRFWDAFTATYCGDRGRAKRLCELLLPFAKLTYFVVSMAHPRLPLSMHEIYAGQVRDEVLPHIDEMRASVDELLTFIPQAAH